MPRQIQMGITDDTKDENGNWKKSVNLPGMQWITLSYRRWLNINSRCREGSIYQMKYPSYMYCRNNFKDYQNFVEWSRQQIGYDSEGYALDKDLLIKGNKIYGPGTCIFLPARINSLLTKRNSLRGDYPIGVCFDRRKDKFISQCNNGSGKQVNLGLFDTPEPAFQAYKYYKESLMKQVAEEYKSIIDPRAYQALINYEVEITD